MKQAAKISEVDIHRIIERDFGKKNHEIVIAALSEYESDSSKGRYRVWAAVLKLSKGDLNKVKDYIDVAKSDFRDVLAWAEYPRQMKMGFAAEGQLSKSERAEIERKDLEAISKIPA